MSRHKAFGERIADALVEDGLLSPEQIAELLELQKKDGVRPSKRAVDKGYVTEQDLVVSMGRVLHVPPINLSRLSVHSDLVDLLPREVAQNFKIFPVSRIENRLYLAMADPLNVLAIDDVRRITKLEVVPLIASEKSIQDKLIQAETGKAGTMEDIIQDAAKKAEEEDAANSLEANRTTTSPSRFSKKPTPSWGVMRIWSAPHVGWRRITCSLVSIPWPFSSTRASCSVIPMIPRRCRP